MTLPIVLVTILLVCGAGLLGVELVAAQGLARDAARTAAVGEVADVQAMTLHAAGRRPVQVALNPSPPRPGQAVTASVRLRSVAFSALGVEVWLPARASMRVEHP